MKTRILSLMLTLILLLSTFAGCSSTDTPKDSPDQPPTGTSSDAPETEPDYSWFEFPTETGKLTVYVDAAMGGSVMKPAIRIFEEMYPGIELESLVSPALAGRLPHH